MYNACKQIYRSPKRSFLRIYDEDIMEEYYNFRMYHHMCAGTRVGSDDANICEQVLI